MVLETQIIEKTRKDQQRRERDKGRLIQIKKEEEEMRISEEAEKKRLAELELKEANDNKEVNPYLLIEQ